MAQGVVDWSPEGGRLVLKTEKGVAVVRSTGGRVTWLTHNARDRSPRWSPDGQEVAFVRLPRCLDDLECKSPSNLSVMRRDGSGLQRLTEHSNAVSVFWAPDGRSILFTAESPDDAGSLDFRARSDVAVIGADGRGLRMLAPNARALGWSPDGKTILFSRPSNGLWTMDADGGRPTRLPLTGAGHALTVISADWGL